MNQSSATVSTPRPGSTDPTPRRRWNWVRIPLSLLLLVLLVRAASFDAGEMLDALRSANVALLAVPFALKIAAVFAASVRLSTVLGALDVSVKPLDLWRVLMVGETINKVVPAGIGSIAYTTVKVGSGRKTLTSQIFDKVAFLIVMLVASAIAAACNEQWRLVAASAAALILGLVASAIAVRVMGPALGESRAMLRSLVASFAPGRGAFARYVAASLGSLVCMSLAFWLLWAACNTPIPIGYAVACTAIVTVAIAIPVTINGIGLREWAIVMALGPLDLPNATLALVILLAYAIGFAASFLGYCMSLWPVRAAAQVPEQKPSSAEG